MVLGLALTHTPVQMGVHVLDFGGGALRPLAGLPHVGTVADRQEVDLVRRTVAEFVAALGRRERLFREAGVTSVEAFRMRRAAGEFADEQATDLLLVIDGYLTLRTDFDDLEARLLPLAAQGLAYGLHLAVSATRWSELRPALKDLLGARLELRLGEPAESEVDRRRAATVPARPGHGLAPDGAPLVLAAPRGAPDADAAAPSAGSRTAWNGPGLRRCDSCRRASTGRPPARRPWHPARRRRGPARARRAGSGRRAAPGVLRRRRERQDHAAAARRPRGSSGGAPPEQARVDRRRPAAGAARRRCPRRT